MILMMGLTSHGMLAQKHDKLKSTIETMIPEIEPVIIEWRHYLHEHPELSNREYKTAEFVAEKLQGFGMEVTTGIAHTGVVGILKGGKPGPVIALRADMDGLPVRERVALDWASNVTGEFNGEEVPVMHACGHDVHMSCLLGAARILNKLRAHWGGTVKLIFQPSEETAPGGARMMIEEGVLENPTPQAIFGQHVFVPLPAGKVGIRNG
ncbi:MAG: amidohydrolase, partial [Cyclobacteriaceae bacterium]|nr:amidohydrolase [Cyclobacteriaceae bacterium]